MTNSVTFPVALGGDGKTYTDDADPDTGLDGLGYTERFVPCLKQAVAMGLSAKDNATAAASFAQQCQTLRNAVSADRQAVASDRAHVIQQRNAVEAAAQSAAQSAASVNPNQIVHVPGSGLPNAAGAAYNRGVIGGSGDLMAEGAYGLGSTDRNSVVVTDGNVPLPSGFFGGTGSQGINFPPGAQYSPLINVNRRSGPGVYNTLRLFSTSTELVVRTGTVTDGEAIWDGDSRIYTDKNILGPVSHLAGAPTGAIIERGSNANGEYVKFAGGTLICFIRKAFPDGAFTAEGPVFSTPSFSVIFPAGFVGERPTVSFGCSFGAAGAWAGLGDSGTNYLATSIKAYKLSAGSSNAIADVIAMGRWY